ncbi:MULTISPECIES: retroviral-like aspartic protease family protein [Phenylobacterium]|uniref:Aspartyl protease n=1 Tax=Phenylobacterium koreense TaxID=266125 RepID=A0ABV2EI81_9CAUL
MAAAGGFLAALPALAFGQVPETISPEPADESPAAIALTRKMFEHITAPVRINGEGPYRFMVDTGANVSCVSQTLARTLELPAGPRIEVNTIVGRRARESVLIDKLEIATRTRKRVSAPVLPMSGFDIDGVLGVDWLKGQRLVMGFAGQMLEITRSRDDGARKGRVVVPARRKSGQLTMVDADLNGRKISAMIDSGSQFSIGNRALRRIIEQTDRTANALAQKVTLMSIAGESIGGDQLYLPFIRIGGLNLGNVPVVFTDMPVFKLWDLHDTPTIMLGIDLLTQFETVALDFGRSSVRFDIADA